MKNDKIQLSIDIHNFSKNENTINSETELVREKLEVLKNIIIELGMFWQGKAADTFRKGFEEDIAELENLLSVAEWISENYRFAVNSYITFEQKAADIINAINI